MKKILITGKNSYIGSSFCKWLSNWTDSYVVEELDMLDAKWREKDFSSYDIIFHVAGIAHKKKVANEIYDKVNYELAVAVAKKAVDENVSHFIFMSSGAVYSQNDKKHKIIVVDENTELTPNTPYGISKMKAEKEIQLVCKGSRTHLAILRPPMIYGYQAKGNYSTLSKFAKKTVVFPNVKNQRSMIFIDNFCEFVRLLIDEECEGIFLPQNKEYVNTTELVKYIAELNERKIITTSVFNIFINLIGRYFNIINKVFGSYYYSVDTEYFDGRYQIVDFKNSILKSENL